MGIALAAPEGELDLLDLAPGVPQAHEARQVVDAGGYRQEKHHEVRKDQARSTAPKSGKRRA